MKRLTTACVCLIVLGGLGSGARAATFFAGRLDADGRFRPAQAAGRNCYAVPYCRVTATVREGRAATRLEAEIRGPAQGELATLCLVPLPAGAVEKSARLTSPALPEGKRARFLSAERVTAVCEALAKATNSPAVLSLAGRPALMVEDFPLGAKVRLAVEFEHPVEETAGLFEYQCPLPGAALSGTAMARLSLNVTVQDRRPLRSVYSPTHETAVARKGLYQAVASVTEDESAGGNYRLVWVADENPMGLRLIAHREEGESEGYFMLVGNPTGNPAGDRLVEKDVVFVLDTSGSMRGEKMEQARAAIEYCLRRLNPGDRFNLVAFGTEVRPFRRELQAASGKEVDSAIAFLDDLVPLGRTNIGGALAAGLAGGADPRRPRIMIFLTDGTPTAGELVPEKILQGVKERGDSRTRVFVVGVGHDVNAQLLDRIAEETGGSSEYVAPREEIDVKVAALFNRISNPVLADATLDFGGLRTGSVYPERIPTVFRGSQLMVFGRYRDGGEHTVTLSGTVAGEKVSYAVKGRFPAEAEPRNEYVASLWAARKVGYLLQQVRLHGEDKELIEEIVRLSRRHGIVTEYTAFIAALPATASEAEIAQKAFGLAREARAEASGRWAVAQTQNEQGLKQRQVAAPAANTYLDRDGRTNVVDNVRQVGRHVFYLRDGRWEEEAPANSAAVRSVKLFSPEYFELVRSNREFREAQEMGGDISINLGKERIEVRK